MKLIIDIDKQHFEILQSAVRNGMGDNSQKIIANGIPLPKGHGRLIDADALEKKMCDREEELGDDRAMWESSAVSVALDMFAPTIIEADKAESEPQDISDRNLKMWHDIYAKEKRRTERSDME